MQTVPYPTGKDPMRWRMLALAAMAYGCFGLGVGSMPPLVDPIIRDLAMTSGQMGMVLGAWQLVFIGVGSPLGSLVDRWGARRAVILGLGLILLSLLLRGLATDFITLLLAVALFGAGAPIISVGMPKLVGQWFVGNDRGPATGTYVVGRDIGSVFALATAASFVISLTGSWRGIAVVYGAITLVVIVLWIVFGKDAPSTPITETAADKPPSEDPIPSSGILSLLKIRNVQLVLMLGFVVFFMNHALGAWLPTVLQENGMSLAASGRWVAAGIGVAMISNFTVPSMARLGRRSTWLIAMLAGGALSTIGLISFTGPALIAMVLAGTIIRLPAMQVLTLILLETPAVGPKRVGTAGGVFFAVAEIGGFTGPLMMGFVRDSTGSLTGGLWVIVGVAAGAAMLPLLLRERHA
ncbi:MAG: MFS transporter [Chloroflexi bacterium]|nr:MFS transporter [Chloroflexota bacterium]MDA1175369.1 MFS transporter [Chloroflexota bacterium]